MFDVGTGDKRAIITPKQKASLIFPQLVLDNEHREGSFKPRTKAFKNVEAFDYQQIQTVEKSIFCDFLPICCACVCVYGCAYECTFSSELQGKRRCFAICKELFFYNLAHFI